VGGEGGVGDDGDADGGDKKGLSGGLGVDVGVEGGGWCLPLGLMWGRAGPPSSRPDSAFSGTGE
jgi:hypothetical protein